MKKPCPYCERIDWDMETKAHQYPAVIKLEQRGDDWVVYFRPKGDSDA